MFSCFFIYYSFTKQHFSLIVSVILLLLTFIFLAIKSIQLIASTTTRMAALICLLLIFIDYILWLSYAKYSNYSSHTILLCEEIFRISIIMSVICCIYKKRHIENAYRLFMIKAIVLDWMLFVCTYSKGNSNDGFLSFLNITHPLPTITLFVASMIELSGIAIYVFKYREPYLPQAPGTQWGVPRWWLPW